MNSKIDKQSAKELAFYALLRHAQTKIRQRQQLIQATQFRYQSLLAKSFASVRSKIRVDHLRLKFKRWKSQYLYDRALTAHHREHALTRQKKLLRIAFSSLKQITLSRQKLRLASEFYMYKLFQKWCNRARLRKARNLDLALKKFKLVQRSTYFRKLTAFTTFLRSYKKSTTNRQLLIDVTDYLRVKERDRLTRNSFRSLQVNVLLNRCVKKRKLKIFGALANNINVSRQLGVKVHEFHRKRLQMHLFSFLKANHSRFQSKTSKAIRFHHSKYLNNLSYERLKELMFRVDHRNLYLRSLFNRWLKYVSLLKNRIQELEVLGNQLTNLAQLRRKRIAYNIMASQHKKLVVQRQLYENLCQYMKVKTQRRLKKVVLRSLQNNRKVCMTKKIRTARMQQEFLNQLRLGIKKKQSKSQSLQEHLAIRRKLLISKTYHILKRIFIGYRNRLRMADQHYQEIGKLLKYVLYAWIGTVASSYQTQVSKGELFCRTRKMCFVFAALRQHAINRIELKIKIDGVAEFMQSRDQSLKRNIFAALKTRSAVTRQTRLYYQRLLQRGFYSWRLWHKLNKRR